MQIDFNLKVSDLEPALAHFWELATDKVKNLESKYDASQGAPVFTVEGEYTTRGWTEWTQGFQYGIPLLIFEATGDSEMLAIGKENTIEKMAHHITHFGVHDHGFNNLSTYGNLLRLINSGKFKAEKEAKDFYTLALKSSASVQANRWTDVKDGGFIYSFNGPHSLFIDTIRSCRILLLGHKLGHRMLVENDEEINLLDRAVTHALTTAKYAVYYNEGRDQYDDWGRVAHESIFNTNDGAYRCPNSQQGFSGFTTWTRGLAWAMLGFSEFLEFLISEAGDLENSKEIKESLLKAAISTCDFYIENTALNGIPYWDTGAPNMHKLGNYKERDAEIDNQFEPIDSSAAAIGAQGLLRLGKILESIDPEKSKTYTQAGLTVLRTLLGKDYLAEDTEHQGILKHSIYHYPNDWDHIPKGATIPSGESSMWGDYHITELCLTAQKLVEGDYYTFHKDVY
jgi:hypothetical protein